MPWTRPRIRWACTGATVGALLWPMEFDMAKYDPTAPPPFEVACTFSGTLGPAAAGDPESTPFTTTVMVRTTTTVYEQKRTIVLNIDKRTVAALVGELPPDPRDNNVLLPTPGRNRLRTLVLHKAAYPYIVKDYTFASCDFLERVVMGDYVLRLGRSAFHFCVRLRSVPLSSMLKEISYSCFAGCRELRRVKLPPNVRIVDNHAFYACERLHVAELNEGLRSIGFNAFAITALRRVRIPASVTKIRGKAFQASRLKVVYFAGRGRTVANITALLPADEDNPAPRPKIPFPNVVLVLCDAARAFRSGDAAADAALRGAQFPRVADDENYGLVLPSFGALGKRLDRMGLLTDEERAALERIEPAAVLDFSRLLGQYGFQGHTANLMMHVNSLVSGGTWFEV